MRIICTPKGTMQKTRLQWEKDHKKRRSRSPELTPNGGVHKDTQETHVKRKYINEHTKTEAYKRDAQETRLKRDSIGTNK